MSSIMKIGNKFFREQMVNGRLTMVEIPASQAIPPVPPPSSAETCLQQQIAASKQEISQAATQNLEKTRQEVLQAIDDAVGGILRVNLETDPAFQDMKGKVTLHENSFARINNTVESCLLHNASSFEYEAEKWRWMGQSGLVGGRQYSSGGQKTFMRPFDVGYNPMNIHTHSDYLGLQGTAELVLSMNGYLVRTRHNDYRDLTPHSTSKAYQATERLPRPTKAPGVTGTVAQQMTSMRDLYRRLDNTINKKTVVTADLLTAAEKALFRWDMAYAECWWEVLVDGNTDDPGNDTRHTNASNNIKTMLREAQFYSYGGHKNTRENTGYWVAAVREVDINGNPSLCVLKFRILMRTVGTLANWLPSDLFNVIPDHKTMARFNYSSFETLRKTSRARFMVKETNNAYGLLDQLVGMVPGLDNASANITETYLQADGLETIRNHTNTANLNAGYYSRYTSIVNNDASGRSVARRGFNDPYLFVASNTQAKCKAYPISGRDYRFSYMIPIEMVMRHPLEVWNPYDLEEKAYAAITGAGTVSSPYTGINENLRWYHIPSAFFDARIDADAADTAGGTVQVLDRNGVVRSTKASGTYIFLPKILGDNGLELVSGDAIRIRYPIYPSFHEGSYAFAELKGYMENLATGKNIADPVMP